MSKKNDTAPAKGKKTVKKPKQTAEEKEAATIAKAEKRLVEKHGDRIVKGSVRRAKGKAEQDKYRNKLLCTINTLGVDGKPDGKTLDVATSDVHQVKYQPEVKAALRKAQREEAKASKSDKKAKASKSDKKAKATVDAK